MRMVVYINSSPKGLVVKTVARVNWRVKMFSVSMCQTFLKKYMHPYAILTVIAVPLLAILIFTAISIDHPAIFFVETKMGKDHPTSLESCAVESAARVHPRSPVIVYKTYHAYNVEDKYVQMLLSNFPNVHFTLADMDDLFADTPLQEWHRQKRISESLFPEVHLSDAIRVALLWKYGGIYLDTDVITFKSLSTLTNSIGLEHSVYGDRICNAVLIFDRQFPFMFQYMQRFASDFNGQLFSFQGPKMITQMFRELCQQEDMDELVKNSSSCLGINIQQKNAFYPVEYVNSMKYVLPATECNVDFSRSYTTHVNRHGHYNAINPTVNSDSLLNVISERFCPFTHRLMLRDGILQDLYANQTK